MREKTIKIKNKLGMHARPAALIVQTVSKFKSEILIKKDELCANGRSIMSVMMLAAEKGSQLVIQAKGEDEEAVLTALANLINDKFYEE